ncbi:MAG: HAMP domain-containing histidine kinase, partial [Acaryochloridaceae cyanobacterium CSU_5_19]|nr:HAMP domain-containing histidine kinase [Acaryochloridaceae cyanobacterium CSU_5_19]
ILLLDEQGIMHYVSPSLERNLGYLPRVWTGQPLTQWLHAEDQSKAIQLLQEVLTQPHQTLSMEWRWQNIQGDWSVFEALAQQFTDATGLVRIVVHARDMTERLRVEAMQCALEHEKEMSELKLRFFSMASHEFRTPLSVILMAAQILENSEPEGADPKRLRNIQRIQASAQSLKKMLSDVLDIARIEAQELEFKPEWIDLRGICDRILDTHQTTHEGQPRLDYTYIGSSAEVYLDPQLLGSILTNLITNALKYSPADQPIKVLIHQLPERVELEICDRGIGIPAQNQAQLFETFHRGDNVGQIEGSGLGLAIVKKSVDLHKGQITFTSNEGQGTTFTVCLPKPALKQHPQLTSYPS